METVVLLSSARCLKRRAFHLEDEIVTEWKKHSIRSALSSCYKVHSAMGGILPGKEMVRAISTRSVIITNIIPSGKQVRECGAQVKSMQIISRSVCSYSSALPQYLERDARGMRTPCASLIFCKFARTSIAQVGSVLCGAQTKRKRHPQGVPFLFAGDPYGNRTHVFSVRG